MNISQTLKDEQLALIQSGIDSESEAPLKSEPFWRALRETGTELWLDTGDIDEASEIWCDEMSALTTNNTLLNKEIQKGIYDDFIKDAGELLHDLPVDAQVVEIAFMLNARHGLRLVKKFGARVSVELHTNTAHDLEKILNYGMRYHRVDPDNFIIKVPYTPTGLLGARKLNEQGVPINFTLEFSARQNALVATIVKPDYLNVFLGRINGYVLNNELGDGKYAGEKATIESQKIVHELTMDNAHKTRQIAASMRSAKQLDYLAGIDVFTMPVRVAKEGIETLTGTFKSNTDKNYEVGIRPEFSDTRIEKTWEVGENEKDFIHHIKKYEPGNANDIIGHAKEYGCADMFPDWTDEDLLIIQSDGKIPDHKKWAEKIKKGTVAPDTLLNMAGLLTFSKDQEDMDNRVRDILTLK